MTPMTPEQKPLPDSPSACTEKARLFEQLSNAMAGILALNTRETEAVIAGNMKGLETFRIELQRAREHKDSLLLAYTIHIESHGC